MNPPPPLYKLFPYTTLFRSVNKVIDYIEQNGYVESISELTRPPFDKPQSFMKLFDEEKRKEFVNIINEVKDNATKIIS